MHRQTLTIVMYHYVRPLRRTRFPEIKGLDLALFREQLAYLKAHYTPVSMDEVIDAVYNRTKLPASPVLLTFDDGYLDHYQYVFPLLVDAGLSGAFYPPSGVVLDRRVLGVNKIHFVLASSPDKMALVDVMESEINKRARLDLHDYRRQYWSPSRFDPPEVCYVKNLLQHALPEELRAVVVDELFERFVTSDEEAFAEELYVSLDHLRVMSRLGMHIGSHGDNHDWLDRLDADGQARDIERSLRLLDAVGVPRDRFTFCYPYGAYNSDTLEVLRTRGCKIAVTTAVELARIGDQNSLELPRLDTNDLPKDRNASANHWTQSAAERH